MKNLKAPNSSIRGQWVRKGLAITQFGISIGLIIGILVIHQQLNYIKNKDLGYDRELVLTVKSRGDIVENFDVFKARVLANPNVVATCVCDPVFSGWSAASLRVEGFEESQIAAFRYVGEGFDRVFGLNVVEGRSFDANKLNPVWSDSNSVFVINQAAVKQFGWQQQAIGKTIEYIGSNLQFKGKVIGVVEDFNFASLHEPVGPLVMRYFRMGSLSFKINSGDVAGTLRYLEDAWTSLAPEWPFEYTFVDDKVAQQYQAELSLGKIMSSFTAIALCISCLGFFGLASFMAENRTRELGIRKILGASVKDLIFLLEKEFVFLSVLSFLIALPLAYHFVGEWLDNFAYQTDISPWLPILALTTQLMLVLITVSYHVIKCSQVNPVNTLRLNE